MDEKAYLEKFQNQIKMELIKDTDGTLDILNQILDDVSDLKNQIIILFAQNNDLKVAVNKGIIDYKELSLRQNQIRDSIINTIDLIQYGDVNPKAAYLEDNDEFHQHYESYEQAQPKAEAKKDDENPFIAVEPSGSVTSDPFKQDLERVMGTKGLEIVTEDYRDVSTFYPKLHRNIRAIVSRGNANDELLNWVYDHWQQFVDIHQRTEEYEKYSNDLKFNSDIKRKIEREIKDIDELRRSLEYGEHEKLDAIYKLLDRIAVILG